MTTTQTNDFVTGTPNEEALDQLIESLVEFIIDEQLAEPGEDPTQDEQ
jgi:hypothetical protein